MGARGSQPASVLADRDLAGTRVLVTGGAGFVGSHLVRRLCEAGVQRVVVVDSLRYGDLANLSGYSDQVEVVQHTLGSDDPEALRQHFEGCDYLFHLAAEKHNQSKDEPARVVRANIEGTLSLYELAARASVGKIVFSSSLYAYGRTSGGPFVESEVPRPQTVYGVSKLAGEHLLRYIQAQYRVPWVCLRYLFVYGPRQFAGMGYKSVILRSFERLSRGEPPVVFGDGNQALDYVFVDDVVEATLRAAFLDVGGEVLNVASGKPTTVNELLDLMIEISGQPVEKLSGPADWTAGTRRYGDPDLAARLLGWRATTSLREGLTQTWEWVLSQTR